MTGLHVLLLYPQIINIFLFIFFQDYYYYYYFVFYVHMLFLADFCMWYEVGI